MRHLNLQDRIEIQKGITFNSTSKFIAQTIQMSNRTVARELKENRLPHVNKYSRPATFNDCQIRCANYESCQYSNLPLCKTKKCDALKCAGCSIMNPTLMCRNLTLKECPLTSRYPFVCNGCDKKSICTLQMYLYDANQADKKYQTSLSNSRSGLRIDPDTYVRLDEAIRLAVAKGHSLDVIASMYPEVNHYSISTLYRLISEGKLSTIRADLPKAARYGFANTPKNKDSLTYKFKNIETRAFADYLDNIRTKKIYRADQVEMDTVIGLRGDKQCLLTIHFIEVRLMLIFLLSGKNRASVLKVFRHLQFTLGDDDFKLLFPFILTDRGSEFSGYTDIEINEKTGEILTHVYFCDPQQSSQKASIENNHLLIRRILSKGTSFESLKSSHAYKVRDHINSYPRKSLNYLSPNEAFIAKYGQEIFKKLGLNKVKRESVLLSPALLYTK